MDQLSRSVPRLPWFLAAAVRFGTSPAEWPDALACYERVYVALVTADGEGTAKWWALKNTAWLILAGALNYFR